MKKIITIILAAALVLNAAFSLSGCSAKMENKDETSSMAEANVKKLSKITLNDKDYTDFVNSAVIPEIGIADREAKKEKTEFDGFEYSYNFKSFFSKSYTGLISCCEDDLDGDKNNELLCIESYKDSEINDYRIKMTCYKKADGKIEKLAESDIDASSIYFRNAVSYIFITENAKDKKYISVLSNADDICSPTQDKYNNITVYTLDGNGFSYEYGLYSSRGSDGGPYCYNVSVCDTEGRADTEIYRGFDKSEKLDGEYKKIANEFKKDYMSERETKKYIEKALSAYGIKPDIFNYKNSQFFLNASELSAIEKNTKLISGLEIGLDKDITYLTVTQKDYTKNEIAYL